MTIIKSIQDKPLYDMLSDIEMSNYQKLEKYYGEFWYRKFYNVYHIGNTFHLLKTSGLKNDGLQKKFGDEWFKKHVTGYELADLKLIYSISKEIRLPKNEVLIHENEKGDELFIITGGTLEVSKFDPEEKSEYVINTLFVGDVAGGPLLLSQLSRMMMIAFGEGWIKGGKLSAKIIRPAYAGDFITAKGIIKEKLPENSGVRYVCDVWVEKQTGEKVIVGTASGLVR